MFKHYYWDKDSANFLFFIGEDRKNLFGGMFYLLYSFLFGSTCRYLVVLLCVMLTMTNAFKISAQRQNKLIPSILLIWKQNNDIVAISCLITLFTGYFLNFENWLYYCEWHFIYTLIIIFQLFVLRHIVHFNAFYVNNHSFPNLNCL